MRATWSLSLHPAEKEGQDDLGGDAQEREAEREEMGKRGGAV